MLEVETVPCRAWYLPFHCPGPRTGFFQMAYRLRDDRAVPRWERHEAERLIDWFSENLNTPRRFARGPRPHLKQHIAICWFKESASVCLQHAWELAHLLERNDVLVEFRRTGHPGYVVFEDQNQVAAIPLRDR